MIAFGKSLRVLRIKHDERLYDMACKLGVSPAFLSSVENGKRRIPVDWVTKIAKLYELMPDQTQQLQIEADGAMDSVRIDLANANSQVRAVVMMLSRELPSMSDDKVAVLARCLTRGT